VKAGRAALVVVFTERGEKGKERKKCRAEKKEGGLVAFDKERERGPAAGQNQPGAAAVNRGEGPETYPPISLQVGEAGKTGKKRKKKKKHH